MTGVGDAIPPGMSTNPLAWDSTNRQYAAPATVPAIIVSRRDARWSPSRSARRHGTSAATPTTTAWASR